MKQRTNARRTIDRASFGLVGLGIFMAGALAACGSSNSATTTTSAGAAAGTVVSVVHNAMFGNVLTSAGKTLYTLVPSSTACDASCTQIWPELVLAHGVNMATAGSGMTSASLGTIDRGNGVVQVTYGGQALYFYSGDTADGQVNGNLTDTWGKWSVAVAASPAGNGGAGATTTPKPAGTTTTAGGGVGGGGGF